MAKRRELLVTVEAGKNRCVRCDYVENDGEVVSCAMFGRWGTGPSWIRTEECLAAERAASELRERAEQTSAELPECVKRWQAKPEREREILASVCDESSSLLAGEILRWAATLRAAPKVEAQGEPEPDDEKRDCDTCRHADAGAFDEPCCVCKHCVGSDFPNEWEPWPEEPAEPSPDEEKAKRWQSAADRAANGGVYLGLMGHDLADALRIAARAVRAKPEPVVSDETHRFASESCGTCAHLLTMASGSWADEARCKRTKLWERQPFTCSRWAERGSDNG